LTHDSIQKVRNPMATTFFFSSQLPIDLHLTRFKNNKK